MRPLTNFDSRIFNPLGIGSPRKAYRIGLALIVVLVTLQFGGAQIVTNQQEVSAVEINLSGRQRMLSQRISWQMYQLASSTDQITPAGNENLRAHLAACINLMERSHRALLSRDLSAMRTVLGEGDTCLSASQDTPSALPSNRRQLDEDTILASFTQQAWRVATEDLTSTQVREIIDGFEQPVAQLLKQLDQLTLAAQEQSTAQIQTLLSLNWILILGLILGEIILIFRPMAKAVDQSIKRLKTANQRLSESEARLQDFAETAAHQFWETDAHHRLSYLAAANPNTRLAKKSIQLGLPLWEQKGISSAKNGEGWTDYKAALDAQRPFNGWEYSIESAQRHKTYWRAHGRPVFSQSGAFEGFRGTSMEITSEREAEERLRMSERMMAVGQLTAGVAHDFNNILAVIQGNAELLNTEKEETERARTTNQIILAVRRAASLTSRLLSFGRVQRLSPEAIELAPFLSDLKLLLDRTLGEDFEVSVAPPSIPLHVLADRHQLEDACLNLALNARDAAHPGGRLWITVSEMPLGLPIPGAPNDPAPAELIKISFRDNGAGVPEDIQERIFEPFFTTKSFGKGSGLGLSMVYGFSHQSGGFLEVTSTPGEGTTIDLYLPKVKDGATTPAAQDEYPSTAIASGMSVLLVEDNDALRRVTRRQLENFGFIVIEASDGGSALERLNDKGPIDILVLDIVLPGGIDGFEVGRRALESNPDVSLLFCSGFAGAHRQHEETGALSGPVLSKPFSKEELRHALERLIYGAEKNGSSEDTVQ